jgi:TRAP-type C4-dicarboxylate transport system permease large subunit
MADDATIILYGCALAAALIRVAAAFAGRWAMPLIVALLVVLAISTYWPGLVLWIPNLFQAVR